MTYKSTLHCSTISHLAYADDILIFTQASTRAIRRLKKCLTGYERVSGQLISPDKSNFYIAEAHEDWAESIQSRGGFSRGTFPFMYLGVPIYRGAKRTDMFLFLREKIAKRINGWAHRHLSFGGRLTLIKSTLEAIPIHTFQAIEPTSGVIQQLEQQLARFFWGSTNDRKRTHWISWGQICLPVAEGGLGVRSLSEVLRAFSIKLWWRFREQNSLWATHMYSKYCRKTSPLTLSFSGRCSPTWRRLSRSWTIAHPHIRWVLGEGNILFWDDVWLGDRPLRERSFDDRGSPLARVSEFWLEGHWNRPKLQVIQSQSGLPQQVIEEILATPIVHGMPDTPRWSLSNTGNFTLASAWETIRSHRPIIPALEEIWHGGITKSISIFIWRLLSNRVPVDTKLQWRKIELASKCHCCPTRHGIESPQHLFINGLGAAGIWQEFDAWFPGASDPLRPDDSIPERLERWARRIKQPEKTHLCRITPCLVLWFLWAERNRCRHNETTFRPQNVIWQVQMHVWKLITNGQINRNQMKGVDCPILATTPSATRSSSRLVMPVKWNPPDHPWIKLNTASRFGDPTNQASGGGTIRDHRGRLLLAFSTAVSASSSLETSAKVMVLGISAAKEFGSHIWGESDDQQVISLATSRSSGPAHSRHEFAKLITLQRDCTTRFATICGGRNKAAIFLAKQGGEQPDLHRFNGHTAPRLLKAIIRLEQMGVPYLSEERRDNEETAFPHMS